MSEPITREEVNAYLRAEGLDPEVIAKNGLVFVATCFDMIAAKKKVTALTADLAACRAKLTEELNYRQCIEIEWTAKCGRLKAQLAAQPSAREQVAEAFLHAALADANGDEDSCEDTARILRTYKRDVKGGDWWLEDMALVLEQAAKKGEK